MPYVMAFALTLAIEVLVVLALLAPRPQLRWAVLTVVGANAVTHPLVWITLEAAQDRYWTVFPVAETAAWLVESALVAAVWPREARGSVVPTMLVANASSCLVGLLLARNL